MSIDRGFRPLQIPGYEHAPENLLSNAAFDFWQRGSGPFTVVPEFSADEWLGWVTPGSSYSISRDSGAKIGSYCLKYSFTIGTSGSL